MDWEDETLLNYLRLGYFAEQLLLLVLCGLLYLKVCLLLLASPSNEKK
jgi:hypothetical protein